MKSNDLKYDVGNWHTFFALCNLVHAAIVVHYDEKSSMILSNAYLELHNINPIILGESHITLVGFTRSKLN